VSFNTQKGTRLTSEDLERQMYMIHRGRAYGGFDGYRHVVRYLPVFWLLVPLLHVPGISRLGERTYAYVAKRRVRWLQCDDRCRKMG
jgi:predicted DCC family thiol-disulfide oxidoreductase YuxK